MTEPPAPLILVVDDFVDNREMYVEYLRFVGYRVEEAGNGADALARAAEVVPDAIVMDLSLPGIDGWEATRRLKADVRTKHVPILALTGHALAGHSQSATEAGCDLFITKPCLPEALERELRVLLGSPGHAKPKTGRR